MNLFGSLYVVEGVSNAAVLPCTHAELVIGRHHG